MANCENAETIPKVSLWIPRVVQLSYSRPLAVPRKSPVPMTPPCETMVQNQHSVAIGEPGGRATTTGSAEVVASVGARTHNRDHLHMSGLELTLKRCLSLKVEAGVVLVGVGVDLDRALLRVGVVGLAGVVVSRH